MESLNSLLKNSVILFVAQLMSAVFSFIYIIYIARYLGAEGFGIISFALSFSAILVFFSDIGLSTLITREISRDKTLLKKYMNNVILIKSLISVVILVISIAFILIYNLEESLAETLILTSIVVLSFSNLFYAVFQAYEKIKYQAIGTILYNFVMLIGIVLIAYYGYGIIEISSIYLVSSIFSLIFCIIVYINKFSNIGIEIDIKFWKLIVKQAIPFGLTYMFVTIFYNITPVILSFIKGSQEVGWYNAAYKFITFILLLPGVINLTIFPIMSKLFISSNHSLKIISNIYLKYTIIIALPIGVGTTILANKIILLIFGFEYANSIIALQILVWSAVFVFISSVFVKLFESSNKQFIVTKIITVCVIENILLNIILVPYLGYIGSCLAITITELTSLVFCIFVSLRLEYNLISREVIYTILKSIIANLTMIGILLYLNNINLSLLISISIFVYIVIFGLLKGFNKGDLELLKNII
jgi:O-antigen/teichoic acid export membrane protein